MKDYGREFVGLLELPQLPSSPTFDINKHKAKLFFNTTENKPMYGGPSGWNIFGADSTGGGTGGVSGTSGSSGTSGINGINGTSGTSGSNGINGTSGTSGINGTSGSSGSSGSSGTSFIWRGNWTTSTAYVMNNVVYQSGSSYICTTAHNSDSNSQPGIGGSWASYWSRQSQAGTSGSSGTSGTNGGNGINGTSGSSGTSGTSATGVTSGTSGINGTSGTSGINGTSGTSGINGTSGTSGTSPSASGNVESTITPSDSVTINWSTCNSALLTLNRATTTITMTNPVAGNVYRIRLLQDATGGRLITFSDSIKWRGGSAPTLTSTANKADWITLVYTSLGWDADANCNF